MVAVEGRERGQLVTWHHRVEHRVRIGKAWLIYTDTQSTLYPLLLVHI